MQAGDLPSVSRRKPAHIYLAEDKKSGTSTRIREIRRPGPNQRLGLE